MHKRLLLLLCLIPAAILLAGCLPWSTPEIVYGNTDVKFLSFDTLDAKSVFTIKNPNPFALHGKVVYELFVNGSKFLDGQSDLIEMPAGGSSSFALDSKIEVTKAFGVLNDLIREIQSGRKTIPFEIAGKFKSDVANIPLEAPLRVSGELPLPDLPQVDFQSLSLSSLSLDGSTVKLRVKIRNNNDFPIKVDPFPYKLMSDGKEILSGSLAAPITLPAQTSKEISFDLNVNFSQLSQALLDQIKQQSLQAEVKSDFKTIR